MTNNLTAFLLGTIDPKCALSILRGKGDILRLIWIYACSEWWQLHIQPYQIPNLLDPTKEGEDDEDAEGDLQIFADFRKEKLYQRKKFHDCPFAILDQHIPFPPNTGLNVNMMPFDLLDPEGTLPESLYGYLPIIEKCRSYNKAYIDKLYLTRQKREDEGSGEEDRKRLDVHDIRNRIAYITVDERPISELGQSHRRGGVHVECPGALRRKEIADKSKYTSDLSFYHPWGSGRAIDEFLVGGIYLASNVSRSTAVWNSRIHDTFGDIIGPHGSLERMRDLLGPADKVLDAGELIWLSDRTPHESLPIRDASVTERQFFRLVVGEIGFWFADHNTANPLFGVPEFVPVVHGNKFNLIKEMKIPIPWEPGNAEEIKVAYEEAKFRARLYRQAIGFMADDLLKMGIYTPEAVDKDEQRISEFIRSTFDRCYYSNFVIH